MMILGSNRVVQKLLDSDSTLKNCQITGNILSIIFYSGFPIVTLQYKFHTFTRCIVGKAYSDIERN